MTGEERGELLQKVADEVGVIRENQAYLKGHVEQMSARIAEIPPLVIDVEKQSARIKVILAALLAGMLVTAPAVFASILAMFGL